MWVISGQLLILQARADLLKNASTRNRCKMINRFQNNKDEIQSWPGPILSWR